ncbi:hypothetical protein ACOMHN_056133 [Nucella lapillus]
MAEKLHELCQLIWQHEKVSKDFKDDFIMHLHKRKGIDRPATTSWNLCAVHRRQDFGRSPEAFLTALVSTERVESACPTTGMCMCFRRPGFVAIVLQFVL